MDSRIFLESCLKQMAEHNASDLHIKSDLPPRMRVAGRIKPMTVDAPPAAMVKELAESLMSEYHKDQFEKTRCADLAFTSETYGRFRANVFWQRGTVSLVIRTIKSVVPPFEDLYIPSVFEKIAMASRGLILIAGATSSGKSTTVAAMVNYMNQNREAHIVTIEDPIEYVHEDKRCLVNQREIGADAVSFSDALKYVVRQDPDIVIIGEMRDAESFQSAVAASETGHLVISTIHAKNVAQAFERILGFFPAEQHEQVLVQLSFNVQAICCQRLLKRKDDMGVVPAFEILRDSPAVQKLIRDNDLGKLQQAILNGEEEGMQTFNKTLCAMYNDELISKEEALMASDNAHSLEMNMKGIFLDDTSGGILDR